MFVHLRLHSEFSIVDGTLPVSQAVKLAAKDQQPALALTDLNNMFGAIAFYKAAINNGVKPILGAEVMVVDQHDKSGFSNLLLLAKNQQGYRNLTEILTKGWLNDQVQTHAFVTLAIIQQHSDGLIALSGGFNASIGKALLLGDMQRAIQIAQQYKQIFADSFYIEVQRIGRAEDEFLVQQSVQLASQLQLPIVATQPIQFAQAEDFHAHEARVCISTGEILANPKRAKNYTTEQYFKTTEQMQQLFADLPTALANTVEIAKRCSVEVSLGKVQLPLYPIPDGLSEQQYFIKIVQQGLEQRLQQLYPDEKQRQQQYPQYQQRLEFEISTILNMGFPGYFLIVSDFINWAKNNGCPVGPGRGSGAGSLVAYVLNITDLDPLKYNLLFERFLNPERVSMPDFDVDFCQANRDRVIDYVKEKYGKNAVSQIATFGTMAARAAIRDVGRVLDFNYNFCDGISKLIPNKPGMAVTIQYPPQPRLENDKRNYAIELEPQLAHRIETEDEVRTVIELAQKLEGITRNVGMHAGGVLIAPGKLTDFCPLYQQPGSNSVVSQFAKDDVEEVGLVKFDFLGLATLTILDIACKLINQHHPELAPFDLASIPLDDKATYNLFAKGKTEAVFQFESQGMQNLLKDAKPTRLEDLIALNALYRPGPMDLIPSFVARKHGREEVVYPHPLVKDILAETYGIMVYQEQVMQTAQILGGYSLGGADLLRRAMGKKKAEEMAKHRQIFRAGAEKNNIKQVKADEIFDLMEKFAGYGFNKSHAAAYSLLAYQTGWLKVHYPVEFYCGNMTVEMDNTDKLKVLYEDAISFGISFEKPNINSGSYAFEPAGKNCIRYGMGALKGTGEQAIEAIIQARNGQGKGQFGKEQGAFSSLFDFCRRVEHSKINKRTVEALIKAGAFDCINTDRASLVESIDLAFEFASKQVANANQLGLFDFATDAVGSSSKEPELIKVTQWDNKQRLLQEKTAVGFFLTGHLFDDYQTEIQQLGLDKLSSLTKPVEQAVVAGIIVELRVIPVARGRLIFVKLDDKTAQVELRLEEALYQQYQEQLVVDNLLVAKVSAKTDKFSNQVRIVITELSSLVDERIKKASYLQVIITEQHNYPLTQLITQTGANSIEKNGIPVRLLLSRNGAYGECILQKIKMLPTDQELHQWQQATNGNSKIIYKNA